MKRHSLSLILALLLALGLGVGCKKNGGTPTPPSPVTTVEIKVDKPQLMQGDNTTITVKAVQDGAVLSGALNCTVNLGEVGLVGQGSKQANVLSGSSVPYHAVGTGNESIKCQWDGVSNTATIEVMPKPVNPGLVLPTGHQRLKYVDGGGDGVGTVNFIASRTALNSVIRQPTLGFGFPFQCGIQYDCVGFQMELCVDAGKLLGDAMVSLRNGATKVNIGGLLIPESGCKITTNPNGSWANNPSQPDPSSAMLFPSGDWPEMWLELPETSFDPNNGRRTERPMVIKWDVNFRAR